MQQRNKLHPLTMHIPVESWITPIAVLRAPSITGGLVVNVRLNRSLPSTSVSHTIGILTDAVS